MKYSLYCFLFGHKFAADSMFDRRGHRATEFDVGMYRIYCDFCQRCGLTKAEAGITNTSN